MQAAEDHGASLRLQPRCQLVRPLGKGEMDGDANHLGKRGDGWWSLQQILVPVTDLPSSRCCSSDACQRQGRGEHVLAKTGIYVLRIKGIDQLCCSRNRCACAGRWKRRSNLHRVRLCWSEAD